MTVTIEVPVASDLAAGSMLKIAPPLGSQTLPGVAGTEAPHRDPVRQRRSSDALRRVAELEETVLELRRQIIQVQESERQRIARDLHDEVGHALGAAVLRLELEMMQLPDDSLAVSAFQRVRQQLIESNAILHNIAYNLRPRILEDLGLHAALRSLASHAMDLTDLDVTVTISGKSWALDEAQELVILRVVQEGLTNVRKHAHASRVLISLRYTPDGLKLRVADDGIGMQPRAAMRRAAGERAGLGIGGLRERVELAGGRFSIGRGRAGGTCIAVHLTR